MAARTLAYCPPPPEFIRVLCFWGEWFPGNVPKHAPQPIGLVWECNSQVFEIDMRCFWQGTRGWLLLLVHLTTALTLGSMNEEIPWDMS